MRIAVPVKWVPNTVELEYDLQKGRILREQAPGIQNHDDLGAVELALRYKDKYGGSVTLVCMGPTEAEEMLREYLAMGADEAVLIVDERLQGTDGAGTARVLSAYLQKETWDLVVAGKVAADGQTGQVPARLAARLGWRFLADVASEGEVQDGALVIEKRMAGQRYRLRLDLPAVITVSRNLVKARLPTVEGILEAQMKEIQEVRLEDLGLAPEEVGAEGAFFRVAQVEVQKRERSVQFLPEDPESAVDEILRVLIERGVLVEG